MPVLATAAARLAYDDSGEGPPILWLQGVGVSRSAWGPQTAHFSRTHRCLAPDHRGLGGSDGDLRGLSVDVLARDALALADGLGLGRFHLVGHSLGGVVAERVALLARDRVASLALLCTFSGGRDLLRPTGRLMWLGALTRLGTAAMRRRAFARLVSPPALVEAQGVEAVAAALEQAFGRRLDEEPAVASLQLAALRAHDERARLGELSALRVLVGSGLHDPIAPPRNGRALAAAIPGAAYREWDGSHAVTIQSAALVNEALAAHFAGQETLPSSS
jgi:pimeloyl-ACP methyl ester carboxylesterase